MQQALITTYRDPEHIYQKRSCALCDKWESCSHGKNRSIVCRTDYARYGCRGFCSGSDELMNETSLAQKSRRQYLSREKKRRNK